MPASGTADEELMDQPTDPVVQPSAPRDISIDGPSSDTGTTFESGQPPVDWQVTNESNPFQRRLVVTIAGAPVLDLALDPIVVQDVVAGLTRVHHDQRAALGMMTPQADPVRASEGHLTGGGTTDADMVTAAQEIVPPEIVPPDTGRGVFEERPAGPVLGGGPISLGWWRQHKLLAFLLIFAAVFFVFGTISGTN